MVFKRFRAVAIFVFSLGGSLCGAKTPLIPLGSLDAAAAGGVGEGADSRSGSGMPSFDLLRVRYESDEARGFEGVGGELARDEYSVRSFLSKPIGLGGDWKVVPLVDYSFTNLDFGRSSGAGSFGDEELHEIGLNALLFHRVEGSAWTYGAWGRVRLASDLEDISGDDFFYDVGLGVGYEVKEGLTVGLAFVGLEVGGDSLYVPGPVVMWNPSEALSLAMMGPLLISSWDVTDNWRLALRGKPNGGIWNVDVGGESRDYDLSSYVVRIYSEHRIKEKLWLSLGVGYGFGGSFEVRDSEGDRLFEDDLDGGLSFSVGLRLRAW